MRTSHKAVVSGEWSLKLSEQEAETVVSRLSVKLLAEMDCLCYLGTSYR